MAMKLFDNCTVWPWSFLTIVLYGHDTLKACNKKFDNCTVWSWSFLTIVLCGCELNFCLTILLLFHHIFYHFFTVTMHYRWKIFPVKIIWNFFDNCTVRLSTFLTIVLYGCEPTSLSEKRLTIVLSCFLTIVLCCFLTIVLSGFLTIFLSPEIFMIKSISEANCETFGSMMD